MSDDTATGRKGDGWRAGAGATYLHAHAYYALLGMAPQASLKELACVLGPVGQNRGRLGRWLVERGDGASPRAAAIGFHNHIGDLLAGGNQEIADALCAEYVHDTIGTAGQYLEGTPATPYAQTRFDAWTRRRGDWAQTMDGDSEMAASLVHSSYAKNKPSSQRRLALVGDRVLAAAVFVSCRQVEATSKKVSNASCAKALDQLGLTRIMSADASAKTGVISRATTFEAFLGAAWRKEGFALVQAIVLDAMYCGKRLR